MPKIRRQILHKNALGRYVTLARQGDDDEWHAEEIMTQEGIQ